jgi:myo-inositol-1(or 4)-monophosphatase
MNIWDSMALIPVIKGAGGIITDYKGGDAITGTSIIASTPGIHSEIIKTLY